MKSAILTIFLLFLALIGFATGQTEQQVRSFRILEGYVTDSGGRPASGEPVLIEAVKSGVWMEQKSTIADFAGRFQFVDLRAGEYLIFAASESRENGITVIVPRHGELEAVTISLSRKISLDLALKYNFEAVEVLNDKAKEVINLEAAKTINPAAAATINPEAAKTINPEAAATINPEAALVLNPELARILPGKIAATLSVEDAKKSSLDF